MQDQERFAILSGDYNPMHLDPIVARRTLYAHPVVHGLHCVAWAIETYLAHDTDFVPGRIVATFSHPVMVGESVGVQYGHGEDGVVRLRIGGEQLAASIRVHPRGIGYGEDLRRELGSGYAAELQSPSIDEIKGASGSIPLSFRRDDLLETFPLLTDRLGVGRTAALLACTRIVGMECPGLHSLFSHLDVTFEGEEHPVILRYEVERVVPQLSLIRLRVGGAGAIGKIEAFFRPPPVAQPSIAAIAGCVGRGEFADCSALIVGGSRGLGEVAAKIVASGGGQAVITYYEGGADAERIAGECRAAGFNAIALKLDVTAAHDVVGHLKTSGVGLITDLYYFATPPIRAGRSGPFDAPLFHNFARYYVDGFAALVAQLASQGQQVRALYPSSIAVEGGLPGFAEYAAAKAAGECLARELMSRHADWTIAIERFPRIATDQTQSLNRERAAGAIEILLPALRKLRRSPA